MSGPAQSPMEMPLKPGWKLFLLGFLTLYLELALIRYLAGSIWNLGYFPNLVLLATFVGMGTGFLLHRYIPQRVSPFVFASAAVALLLLVCLAKFAAPALPGFGPHGTEIGGEIYFTATPSGEAGSSYLIFGLWFLAVVAVFFCISQRTAKIFRLFSPLKSYTLDIFGSVCGILSFMLLSWLELPAYSWFLLAIPIFLLSMDRSPSLPALAPALVLLCVAGLVWDQDLLLMSNPRTEGEVEVSWSPYQKVEYIKPPGDPVQYIYANGIAHQNMQPAKEFGHSWYSTAHIRRKTLGLPPYKTVMVIGAGSGNDVAAALLNGAEHVDAVEIDPVIARLGRNHHPLRPYDDPRVTLVIDDGRAFLRRTRRHYDLIIFALTDSLVKVSAMAQLRLENYLFTQESMHRAANRLTDTGDIVFYNFYRQPWLIEKYKQMCYAATGKWPRTIYKHADFEGLMVSPHDDQRPPVGASRVKMDIPIDDWPFPYLRERGMPGLYIKALLAVAAMIVLLGFALNRLERRRGESSTEAGGLLTKLAFVLMGLAFLLLETKSIVQFSLLFGTTWINTSMVFLAVLTLVLAANWVGQLPKPPPLVVVYALLLGSCLLTLLYPLSNLLRLDNALVRFIFASLITFTPVFFANLLFSITFRHQKVAEQMFGWNLLGATLGGLLEYSSMALGYNALAVIVAICYTVTFALLMLARRLKARRAAELPPPPHAPSDRSADDGQVPALETVTATSSEPLAVDPPREAAAPAARPVAALAAASGHRRRVGQVLLLIAILMAAYHLNGDFLPAADTIPSTYAASSLIEDGNLSFTAAEMPFMFRSWARRGQRGKSTDMEGPALSASGEHYYLVPSVFKGTFVSTFGPGPTAVATPVFSALSLFFGKLANQPKALWYGGKLTASLCVAGSAVFVFLAALMFTRTRRAFLVALAYGLGTCVWTISSQALWQHGPNELFLAMGSYFLLRSPEKGKFSLLCGVALGCAVCCRPSSGVVVAVFGVYLLLTHRRSALLFMAGGLPLAVLLLGYNAYYFGSPFLTGQAIRGPAVALAKTGSAALWQTPLWQGVAGLLVSPSRGLLVYSPFVVFAIWGVFRVWRKKEQWAPLRVITLAVASLFIMQFKWFDWWGGHCYGYRPLVDGMPLLVLFLAVVIDDIRARPVLRRLFGVLLVWSVGVQVVGAFAYNERDWNTQRTEVRPVSTSDSHMISYKIPYTRRPANIDNSVYRYRLWSIRDSQILHYLRFFRSARHLKKTLMLARLAIAFIPPVPAVLQTACSPPVSKSSDVRGVIDIGTPQAHEFLGSGWSIADETIDGRATRWAVGGLTRIQVSLPPRPGDRRLTFVAKPMLSRVPQQVTVTVNGNVVGRATMASRWETYMFMVPEKMFKTGANEVNFKHAWCIQPSMIDPRSQDQRRLAALYDEIALGPLGRLPGALDIDLGTAVVRDKLVLRGGVDGQEQQTGRTYVRTPGPSPTFHFPLTPKGQHYLLTLEARSDSNEAATSAITVVLNKKVAGKIALGRSWAPRSLSISASRFVAGVNTLEFVPKTLSQPDALLARVAIRPVSTSQTIDLGTPQAREYLKSGWSKDEVHDKRTAVWSIGAVSSVELQLHTAGTAYQLQLVARAFEPTLPQRVAVSINKFHVGTIEVSRDWTARTMVIPREVLADGLNTVTLSYSKTVAPSVAKPDWDDSRELAILVDRLSVRPARQPK